MNHITFLLMDIALLPVEEFARRQGRTVESVRMDVKKGYLPIVKKGGRNFINMMALNEDARMESNKFNNTKANFEK